MKPNKYLISVDIEGISGVATSSFSDLSGKHYELAKKYMMHDTNAVIEGIFQVDRDAEIIVRDAHGGATNLDLFSLNKKVSLIQGWGTNYNMAHSLDESFSGLFLVGYHAGGHNFSGVLSHTFSSSVKFVKLNNKIINEAGLAGMYAGHFNVPTPFLSGDDQAVKEAVEQFESIEGVAVKKSYARDCTLSSPLEKVEEVLIKTACSATHGLLQKKFKPFKPDCPMELEMALNGVGYSKSLYQNFKELLGFERRFSFDDLNCSVKFKAETSLEALSWFNLLIVILSGIKS